MVGIVKFSSRSGRVGQSSIIKRPTLKLTSFKWSTLDILPLVVPPIPPSPPSSASRREVSVGPRRCDGARRRSTRRGVGAKDFGTSLLVPPLFLLVVSLLLGADLFRGELDFLLRSTVVVVVNHARRRVSSGDDGFATEDLDLGFKGVGKGNIVVAGLDVMECLRRFTTS